MTTTLERGPTPGPDHHTGGQVLPDTGPPARRQPPVGTTERNVWITVVIATALLGIAGFVNSFERVNRAMAPYFDGLAWTVPLAVDLGILVFTALDLLLAYRDLRSVWLRYVPRALVAVTIYLNVVGEPALEGRVAHAVLPGVWVIAVEVAGIAARQIFGLRTDRARLDRVPRNMWLLAPRSTLRLRRRMILRQQTSLAAATDLDLAYELARADLRDQWGWCGFGWRLRAPRRTKLLLRRGAITTTGPLTLTLPTETGPETTNGAGTGTGAGTGETASDTASDTGPGPRDRSRDRQQNRQRDRTRGPARGRPGITDAGAGPDMDLTSFAETLDDQCHTEGRRLSRRALTATARAAGYEIGTKRATELMAHLATRRAGLAPTGGHTLASFPPGNPPRPAGGNGDGADHPELVTERPSRSLGVSEPDHTATPARTETTMTDTTDPHAAPTAAAPVNGHGS
jgi:hypothetical protein